MTTIFKFNALSGQFDLVTSGLTPGEITGGDPLTVAGYNAAGVLDKVPGLTFDAAGQIVSTLVLPGPTSPTSLNIGPIISAPLAGQYQGIFVGPTVNDDINGYRGVTTQVALNAETSYGSGFQDNPQFGAGAIVTGDYTGVQLGGVFDVGSAVRSYTGVSVNPQFNESITDDLRGVGVFLNTPTVGTNISGLDIAISNATATAGNIKGISINITNSTDIEPQGPVGIESNSRVSVNSETQLQSGLGFQIGNRIAHQLDVASGSPVTGTDSMSNNFAGNLSAQDDIALGGFGVGWSGVGFISSVAVAATKTVAAANAFLPVVTLPDPGYTTGGTITDLSMVRVIPPLAQGGTVTATNLYGYKIDSAFGDFGAASANAWGLFLDTSAPNYMGTGTTQLGGATSGRLSIQAAAVTTSHTLTMPAAQGAASTVLTNDGAGNLSWSAGSTPGPTTVAIANNQVAAANVTGFLVNPATNHAFVAETSTERYHTGAYSSVENTAFYANTGTALSTDGVKIIGLSTGKVLVGSQTATFNGNTPTGLVLVNADGTENAAFSTNLGTGFNQSIRALAEQADGKIVVGGDFSTFNGNTRNYLVRLNADGTEDATFYTNLGTSFDAAVNYVSVQADQKILVGGFFTSLNGNTRNYLVRLNTDGTVDATFYTNLGTSFNGPVYTVIEAANTDILVGGNFLTFNGNGRQYIVRLDSTGTEVAGFNANYDTAGGVDSLVYTIAEQADTKLVIGGNFNTYDGAAVGRIIRLNANGTPDSAFITANGSGFAGPSGPAEIRMQGTNIIAVGGFTSFNGTAASRFATLLSTGAIDTTFAATVGTGFNQFTASVYVNADQTILVTGQFTLFNGNTRNRIIVFGTVSDLDYISQDTIKGVYHSSTGTWTILVSEPVGDVTGVSYQMTNLGQLQYTSSNISGTLVTSQMKYTLEAL